MALLMVSTALAGCIGSSDDELSTDQADTEILDWVFEDFIVADHDHADPIEHQVSSPTTEAIAHHALSEDGVPHSYIGELDTRAGLTAVAILGQGSTPGFVLLDTSDPSTPELLGRAEAPYSYAVDVKLTSDGAYALLATQEITSRTGGQPTPDALADGTYAARNGIMVWDITDPTNPTLASFAPAEALGCHMISVAEIDGEEWVFCINQSLTVYRFERSPEPTLVQAGAFWPFGTEGYELIVEEERALPGPLPHDMTYQPDPIDGTPTLTVSHWDLGVVTLDVSNPQAPEQRFRWNGQGAEHYQGFVHSAMLTELDDKRVLVASPETLDDILPAIWVLDVTDWDNPELLAEWSNPGGHTSQGLLMTTHQLQIVGERLYLAYNHNGLWVLNLTTMIEHGGSAPDAREIEAVHLPSLDGELYDRDAYPSGVPGTWDVNVVGGYVLMTDRYTGLHVTHIEGDPITPGWTSFA